MKIRVVIRAFSKEKDEVLQTVERVKQAVMAIRNLSSCNLSMIEDVFVMVPQDKRFSDCDYGESPNQFCKDPYLKNLVDEAWFNVVEIKIGDLFCVALNLALISSVSDSVDSIWVVSPEVYQYITDDNFFIMVGAVEKGALVTGLAINELAQSVMDGKIANTCAMWDVVSTLSVGGFNPMAGNSKAESPWNNFIEVDGEKVLCQGVEEIIPIIFLGRYFGRCIAPVMPVEKGEWKVPDKTIDKDRWERHDRKMKSKEVRQRHLAKMVNGSFEEIQSYVMR